MPFERILEFKRNHISPIVGVKELSRLERLHPIIYQLTRNLSEEEIEKDGFSPALTFHTATLNFIFSYDIIQLSQKVRGVQHEKQNQRIVLLVFS